MRGIDRLVLAPQQRRRLRGETAEHDVRGVDDVPAPLDVGRLRGVRAHSRGLRPHPDGVAARPAAHVVVGRVVTHGLELRAEAQSGSDAALLGRPCRAARHGHAARLGEIGEHRDRSGLEHRPVAAGEAEGPRRPHHGGRHDVGAPVPSRQRGAQGPPRSVGRTDSQLGGHGLAHPDRACRVQHHLHLEGDLRPSCQDGESAAVARGAWRRSTKASARTSPRRHRRREPPTTAETGARAAPRATRARRTAHQRVGVTAVAVSTRHGDARRTVRRASSGRKRSSSASGVRSSRCRNTGPAMLTTSSGTT